MEGVLREGGPDGVNLARRLQALSPHRLESPGILDLATPPLSSPTPDLSPATVAVLYPGTSISPPLTLSYGRKVPSHVGAPMYHKDLARLSAGEKQPRTVGG